MNHLRSRAVGKLHRGVALVTIAGGLMAGVFVVGASSTAGAATAPNTTQAAVVPAFSGPEPLPQLLVTYVDDAVAFAGGAPALVAAEATVTLDKVERDLQTSLRSL